MTAFIEPFTVATWSAFIAKGATVTGFRKSQRKLVGRITPTDIFICYLLGRSRWVGVLKVVSSVYQDATPHFVEVEDPFIFRFKVRAEAILNPEQGISIKELWDRLDMCKGVEPTASGWAYRTGVAKTLNQVSNHDAAVIVAALKGRSNSVATVS